MGEREAGMRRMEISDWLEEVAGQLRTGTLMIDGKSLKIPEEPRARIKVRSKDGVRRLRLDLELPEEKPSKSSKTSKASEKGKGGKKAKKSGKEQAPRIGHISSERDTGCNGQTRSGVSKENGKRSGVRDYDSHVLVCKGGDCSKKGGKETKKALKSGLREEGMIRDVRVDSVECLGMCKQGPNVIVYPEGSWYLGLKERDVPEVIEKHLKNGEPVERLSAIRKPREKKAKK